MRKMRASYTCGPASIANSLECLGKRVSMVDLAQLAQTTYSEGTDFEPIVGAIKRCGFVPIPFEGPVGLAIPWLKKQVRLGRPVIVCTEEWSHWITVIGALGQAFVVFDPLPHKGTKVLTVLEFEKLWMNKGEGRVCSGIAVKKRRRIK